MKTKHITQKTHDMTMPGKISHDEFVAQIKKAENGPFMTLAEHEAHIDEWMETHIIKAKGE